MKKSYVTIGVIWLVCALTIPVLMRQIQKKSVGLKLEQTVEILQDGLLLALRDNKADKLSETFMWANMGRFQTTRLDKYFILAEKNKGIEIPYFEEFFLNKVRSDAGDTEVYRSMLGLTNRAIAVFIIYKPVVKNKACADIKAAGGNMCSHAGWMVIDLNNRAKPNVSGRDMFVFYITDEGQMVPLGSKDWALYVSSGADLGNYWRNDGSCRLNVFNKGKGEGCAARIVENNWVVEY